MQILARSVGLLSHVVDEEAGLPDGVAVVRMTVEVRAIAAGDVYSAGAARRRRRCDVVDKTRNRLRPVPNLRATLELLDALEAFNRRMIVGRVVAVRRVGQRNSIFEKQDLRRPRRVQPAD